MATSLATPIAHAQTLPLKSQQGKLSVLNRQSPVEPASALGITGTSMGIGIRRVPLAPLGLAEPGANLPKRQAVVPSFHLVKGLWYPVDVGYSFSYIDAVSATLQSFFAQVELLPGYRWPSVAVRISYHSLSSYDWHRAKSLDAAAMITVRGIPWTRLYGAIGGSAHQVETDESPGPFYDNFYTIGAKFSYPNPFVGWSIEHSHWPMSKESEVKIKTSVNI